MSNVNSKDTRQLNVMRWVARCLSIPWAYLALAIVWFIAGTAYVEGNMPLSLNIIVIFVTFWLTLGAVILAGVWGMEALGSYILLADCALMFLWYVVSPYAPTQPLFVLTLFFPPLLAGSLFRVCHRTAKTSEKQSSF